MFRMPTFSLSRGLLRSQNIERDMRKSGGFCEALQRGTGAVGAKFELFEAPRYLARQDAEKMERRFWRENATSCCHKGEFHAFIFNNF